MFNIGIDLGGTNIAAGIVDESGNLLAKKSIATRAERDAEEIIKDMAMLAIDIVRENGYTMDEIQSLGIGTPGAVDKENGEIVYACNLPFSHTPIVNEIRKYIDKPTYIENDANCAAWAEAKAGAAKGVSDAVMITLGTGIGGGIVINGNLYSGINHVAAELGHMVIQADGVQCNCGRKGCFEGYASATALIRMTKEVADKNKESKIWEYYKKDGKITGKTAFLAADDGDLTAKEVVETYIKYLGCGITNIVNIFQPEILVIGGGIINQGETLLKPVRQYVSKNSYDRDVTATKITGAVLGNDAGIIGAALLKE